MGDCIYMNGAAGLLIPGRIAEEQSSMTGALSGSFAPVF